MWAISVWSTLCFWSTLILVLQVTGIFATQAWATSPRLPKTWLSAKRWRSSNQMLMPRWWFLRHISSASFMVSELPGSWHKTPSDPVWQLGVLWIQWILVIPSVFANIRTLVLTLTRYTMDDVLGMGGQYMFSKYKQAAKQFCATKWHHTWTRSAFVKYQMKTESSDNSD